jgi:hypothetical protein
MDSDLRPSLFDGQDIEQAFGDCTVAELRFICQRHICLPHRAMSRVELYTVISQAPSQSQDDIRESVLKSRVLPPSHSGPSFHLTTQPQSQAGEDGTNIFDIDQITESLCANTFMRPPDKETIDVAIADFIDRTNNVALAVGVCAACARETPAGELSPRRLNDIPNSHQLKPLRPHARHDIYGGLLLHPPGVAIDGSADFCFECLKALKADKIPMLSLANELWIGSIPHELAYLTLPERMLIAKFFPAAYIIKLYPKKKGACHWDHRQMYSGLRGNVSTYRLDQAQITSMIDGSILPQIPKILAATIGITFVGPKNLPERGLPNMFKVRRARVRGALEWLKHNNPLFENISISELRLAQLPEDDVPYELWATTKLSTDVNMLYAEQDGYVPSQEDPDGDGQGRFFIASIKSVFTCVFVRVFDRTRC